VARYSSNSQCGQVNPQVSPISANKPQKICENLRHLWIKGFTVRITGATARVWSGR